MNNGEITRPGISASFLARNNTRRVDEVQAESLIGVKASGIWIPYPGLNSAEMIVGDRPFGRLRLDRPNGAKYLQAKATGAQLYIPSGPPFGKELVIVEGEFKAMSLCEAGIRAVGIGGITSAMKDGELIPDLWRLIQKYNPSTIYFLGDSDTVFLFDFSREAVKLARKLPEGCVLRLPQLPLSAPGKGIDDCREALGDGFLAFWRGILEKGADVSSKTNPSALAVERLLLELDTIKDSPRLRDYKSQVVALGGCLDEVSQAELAQAAKTCLGIPISAFKATAARRNYEDAGEKPLPDFYFDGTHYYRPYRDGFEKLLREDALLALRRLGFRHRTANGCELTPTELGLHRIQEEKRVDYAGAICGRAIGFWQENGIRVLCTKGPTIIEPQEGDTSPIDAFLASLFGKDRDPFFHIQLHTFAAWLLRVRQVLKNPNQDRRGQALELIGPPDCGKSLLQLLITPMMGGRSVDPSNHLIKGSQFTDDMWDAEHLCLGDEELREDSRERHGFGERVKKIVTATQYPLHDKFKKVISKFSPIWRLTISANEESEAIAVLPPLTKSIRDKIICLRCYPPLKPYHDGTEEAGNEFLQRLKGAIPAFLYEVENTPTPDAVRGNRFYVKEWHHPEIVQLLAGASPVGPLASLIDKWLIHLGRDIEGPAVELFEELKAWYKEAYDEKSLSGYSTGPAHFGYQLSRLHELPGWNERISRFERRLGDNKQKQTVWKITKVIGVIGT